MKPQIILSPLGQIDNGVLEALKKSVEQAFGSRLSIKPQTEKLNYALNQKRKQYLAPMLLSHLRNLKVERDDRCLGIVDVDLYSPGLNFIFGAADINSGVAVMSLYRLRQERYGLPHNDEILRARAVKEAIHELGHTYYLSHCTGIRCIMHFSNSLRDTDIKMTSFCPKCQQRLKEMG
ncbi:MAG: archaemetzincin family Zn-dependent metalloprotease [Chloroflexota bacterium]